MKNILWLFWMISVFAAMLGIVSLNAGCSPKGNPKSPNASLPSNQLNLDLTSPRASFATLVAAINSDDHAARLACLTTSEKNRDAGAAALNLMQLAVKSPSDGERFLKLLDDHGLTQNAINHAMATYGAGSVGMPGFTQKIGEKIQELSRFHDEISKLAIRPPIEELVFISANMENNQMIGKIKIGSRDAKISFRQVDGNWLIDSPTH